MLSALTFKQLIFLELFLDVFELCGFPHIDTGFGLSQLANVNISILLVPLPLQ